MCFDQNHSFPSFQLLPSSPPSPHIFCVLLQDPLTPLRDACISTNVGHLLTSTLRSLYSSLRSFWVTFLKPYIGYSIFSETMDPNPIWGWVIEYRGCKKKWHQENIFKCTMPENQSKSKRVMSQKLFLPALGAVWFYGNLGPKHMRKEKLQGKRRLKFYRLVFANLDGSPANRSLIKSLYGEFMKADPENSSEGFTGRPGWA